MANYSDFRFEPNPTNPAEAARDLGVRISDLLAQEPYSVEVLRVADDQPLILRVWWKRHCNPAAHRKIKITTP